MELNKDFTEFSKDAPTKTKSQHESYYLHYAINLSDNNKIPLSCRVSLQNLSRDHTITHRQTDCNNFICKPKTINKNANCKESLFKSMFKNPNIELRNEISRVF